MPLATYILNQMGLPLQPEREDTPQSVKGLEKNHTTEENASASHRKYRSKAKVATAIEAMQAQQYGTQEYNMFPERPGQKECKRYMKAGDCNVGATCRYHHPKDRIMPLATYILSQMDQLEWEDKSQSIKGLEENHTTEENASASRRRSKKARIKYKVATRGHEIVGSGSLQEDAVNDHPQATLATNNMANSKYGCFPEDFAGVPGTKLGSAATSLPAKQAEQDDTQEYKMLPERPGQKECKRYMKTGDCKVGATCRYHHPKEKVMPLTTYILNQMDQLERENKSQSCKELEENHTRGENATASCQRHKEARREAKVAAVEGHEVVGICPQGDGFNVHLQGTLPTNKIAKVVACANSKYGPLQVAGVPGSKPGSAATSTAAMQAQQFSTQEHMFPERPGRKECKHYLKTGDCKFRAICRYHHPKDRVIQSVTCTTSPMGIPLQLEHEGKPQSHQGLEEKHMEENTSGFRQRYKKARREAREAMAIEGPEIVDSDCLQEQLLNNQTQGMVPTKVAKGDKKSGKHKLKQKNGKGHSSPVKVIGPTKSITGCQETSQSVLKKSKDRVTPLATSISSATGFPLQLNRYSRNELLRYRCYASEMSDSMRNALILCDAVRVKPKTQIFDDKEQKKYRAPHQLSYSQPSNPWMGSTKGQQGRRRR